MVTGNIINKLSSIGILVIAYSLTDDSNTYYNFSPYPPSIQFGANNFTVEGLPADRYAVSIFVIKENGLPYNRAAATPKRINVKGID